MKNLIWVVITLSLTSLLFAGGKQGGAGSKKIFLITMDSQDEHWLSLKEGAEAEIVKLGADVSLVFQAPPQKADPSEQVRIVEDAMVQGAAGIILAPSDKVALASVVKKVKGKGIPLVIVDSPVAADPSNYLTFASTDNYHAGALAADTLAKAIGAEGEVAIINAQPGSGTAILREQGFTDRLKKAYPKMKVVAIQYSNGEKLLALDQATDIIRGNPNLKGFYACNEGSTVGVSRALESAGLTDSVVLVGFDKSSDVIRGIETGAVDAVMVQNPEKMGKIAVDTLWKHIQDPKAPIEPQFDTGVKVVTKSNLDSIK